MSWFTKKNDKTNSYISNELEASWNSHIGVLSVLPTMLLFLFYILVYAV